MAVITTICSLLAFLLGFAPLVNGLAHCRSSDIEKKPAVLLDFSLGCVGITATLIVAALYPNPWILTIVSLISYFILLNVHLLSLDFVTDYQSALRNLGRLYQRLFLLVVHSALDYTWERAQARRDFNALTKRNPVLGERMSVQETTIASLQAELADLLGPSTDKEPGLTPLAKLQAMRGRIAELEREVFMQRQEISWQNIGHKRQTNGRIPAVDTSKRDARDIAHLLAKLDASDSSRIAAESKAKDLLAKLEARDSYCIAAKSKASDLRVEKEDLRRTVNALERELAELKPQHQRTAVEAAKFANVLEEMHRFADGAYDEHHPQLRHATIWVVAGLIELGKLDAMTLGVDEQRLEVLSGWVAAGASSPIVPERGFRRTNRTFPRTAVGRVVETQLKLTPPGCQQRLATFFDPPATYIPVPAPVFVPASSLPPATPAAPAAPAFNPVSSLPPVAPTFVAPPPSLSVPVVSAPAIIPPGRPMVAEVGFAPAQSSPLARFVATVPEPVSAVAAAAAPAAPACRGPVSPPAGARVPVPPPAGASGPIGLKIVSAPAFGVVPSVAARRAPVPPPAGASGPTGFKIASAPAFGVVSSTERAAPADPATDPAPKRAKGNWRDRSGEDELW
ncbi:hypothetical protein B0J11DRAFT_570461 [Dendryphion nanum]|uniref:Uncharacterized protein n=1 Tax=Dendryphion nanum TaxID=256645 RepID=A0A9P9DGW4_9PLEO|nr:hypothetical protein B0J11DRAFT_570461 [Dendryphion nanum]